MWMRGTCFDRWGGGRLLLLPRVKEVPPPTWGQVSGCGCCFLEVGGTLSAPQFKMQHLSHLFLFKSVSLLKVVSMPNGGFNS